MLNVVILNVIMLNVVTLNVLASYNHNYNIGGRFVDFLTSPNFTFDKLTLVNSEFVKLFLWFFFYEKVISSNFAKLLYLRIYFWGRGMPHGCVGMFPGKEGGIQVLAGLAPSYKTVGSLLWTPHLASPTVKIWRKRKLMNTLQWKNTKMKIHWLHSAKSKIWQTFLLP